MGTKRTVCSLQDDSFPLLESEPGFWRLAEPNLKTRRTRVQVCARKQDHFAPHHVELFFRSRGLQQPSADADHHALEHRSDKLRIGRELVALRFATYRRPLRSGIFARISKLQNYNFRPKCLPVLTRSAQSVLVTPLR
jgi:hypothetical protein